jgi:hypothetical protein
MREIIFTFSERLPSSYDATFGGSAWPVATLILSTVSIVQASTAAQFTAV